MRKSIILSIILAIAFIATPAIADDIFENTDLGIKVDAPNLIGIGSSGNHNIGAEVSITDMTSSWDEGSQAYIKYTYSGTLFSLGK